MRMMKLIMRHTIFKCSSGTTLLFDIESLFQILVHQVKKTCLKMAFPFDLEVQKVAFSQVD